jgi:hypothetical protein
MLHSHFLIIKNHATHKIFNMQISHIKYEPSFFFFFQLKKCKWGRQNPSRTKVRSQESERGSHGPLKSQNLHSQNLPRHLDSAVIAKFSFLEIEITKTNCK